MLTFSPWLSWLRLYVNSNFHKHRTLIISPLFCLINAKIVSCGLLMCHTVNSNDLSCYVSEGKIFLRIENFQNSDHFATAVSGLTLILSIKIFSDKRAPPFWISV